MVLIKRVVLAAAMSLLSEGAIAGGMPAAAPEGAVPSAPQAQGERVARLADVAHPEDER